MLSFIGAIDESLLAGNLRERLTHASDLWPGDPRSAIDWFLESGNVPMPTIAVMTFVRSLLLYFDDEEYVCGRLLALLSASTYTIEGLASLLFPRTVLDPNVTANPADFPYNFTTTNLAIAKVDQVRAEFLDNHPFVVMLVLVREGKFSLTERPRRLVEYILNAMAHDELEINSPELLAHVKKSFSDLEDAEFLVAIEFIKSLKILSSLVEDPEDVPHLYMSNYLSVRSITVQSKSKFRSDLVSVGTSVENALKIYDCAERVDCWNEQLWLHLMNSRRADSAMIDPSSEAETKDAPNEANWMGQSHNNLTDIFRLEDVTCEECCSVTSLSAYFADLLNLLSNTTPSGEASQDQDPPGTRNSLLNLLSQRRPDLRKLELTCANSQTLIPYISLVNEVLESFIRYKYLSSRDPIDVSDTTVQAQDAAHSPHPLNLPGNTDYEVYSKVISQQRFPFTSFPYDQARKMVISYFGIFKIPHRDFVEVFSAPELLLQTITAPNTTDEVKRSLTWGAEQVLERQRAAETLDLHQMEFAAITGETFFPQHFSDLLRGLSSATLVDTGIQDYEFCQLWGYEDDKTMLGSASGLSLIKSQLMQRSGLEFQDVLDLVKTQLFSQELVITNESGSNEFTESIADLRLLSSASNPPFQPLTADICRNLQSFLRLKAKLNWSTKVLDAAIHCLRNREIQSSSTFKPRPSISVYVIKGIASIVKLSDLCGIEPAALIPLWGPIDSFGDESLLHRRFLRASLGPVFAIPKDATYFQPDGKVYEIQACGASICASLKWRFEYFQDLLQATNLSTAHLSIESLSLLYRYVTICRILSVPPKECVPFFKVFFEKEDPLASPKTTLAHITNWLLLLNSGWTIETLLLVLGRPASDDSSTAGEKTGLQLATAILAGAKELTKSLSNLFSGELPTSQNLVECAGRTFDSITTKLVVEFVEGSQINSIIATLDTQQDLQRLLDVSKNWPQKISVIPSSTTGKQSAQIRLAGLLATEEKEKVMHDSAGLPSVNTALQSLVETSLLPRDVIKSRFPSDLDKLSTNILLQDWAQTTPPVSPVPSPDETLIEAEGQVRARRAAFVKLAAPTVVQDALTASILNTVKDLVPDLDISVISYLLTDTVKVSLNQNNVFESAMSILKHLAVPVKATIDVSTVDAYFTPTTTDDFKLHYTGVSPGTPSLVINRIEVPFDTVSKTWNAFRMSAGQPYLLQGDFPPSQISWSTPRSMMTPFTHEELLPSATIKRATLVLGAIRRAVSICQTMQLTTSELEYINRKGQAKHETLTLDFNAPSLKDLVRLQEYRKLRDGVIYTDSDLPTLFSWLHNSINPNVKTIATKVAASTGWKDALVESVLSAKYPNYTPAYILTALGHHDAFMELEAILSFYQLLGNASDVASKPLMVELFYLARPPPLLSSEDTYMEAAKNLQNRLTPSQREAADEVLMENQRKALVAYLLQQKYITHDLGIWDADGLFEHFLADVQMGPQIRTSRIKQAISVVQLFVQRCLLGLETGVSKSVLSHEKWAWMQQYTLWEVHRKIFLYPENWIEPALRDDKSQLFDQFEATLMQKDLSISTFLQAVQTYTYDLDGISSLDILAYVHEPQPAAADIFHFFGRTRSGPYTFYYRTLTRLRTAEVFWRPWTRVEVDIASIETEWEGQRLVNTGSYLLPIMIKGRLYLFIPSIVPKTVVKNISSLAGLASFDALRTQKPNIAEPLRIWEISMAWTEFVNEKWSPKRVSSGSLSVGLEASSSQFRVDPTLVGNILTLQVSYGEAEKTTSKVFGSFIFCNDQLSTTNTGATTTQAGSFPTYFQKALQKGMDLESLPGGSKYTNLAPLMWVPPELESTGAVELSWTLSKLPQRVTGLVVSAKISEGRRASYFNIPKMELLPSTWTKDAIKNNTELVSIDHTFSHELMEATADRVDPLRRLYNKIAQLPAGTMRESFGAGSHEAWYHELGRPTALYNWEVGLHTVLLAVDRFSATQQYEEALEVARLVFDPSADLELDGNNQARYRSCWRFPPFQEMARQIATRGEESFDPLNLDHLSKEIQLAIKERRSYGSLVHAAARGRPVTYMKWIVMKYAEILIAMGDVYFRRATLETLPIATQRYIEAARVLGREPPKVPDLAKRKKKAMTFEQLREEDIVYDNVMFDLGLPFSAKLKKGAAETADRDPKKENIACFLRTTYFCAPLNPKFKRMRSLVHERLYNLRNSFDIQGKPVVYGLREPPIDPGALIALSKQGLGVSDVLSMVSGERDSPLPRQRFDTLLRKALALCTEVRKLSERLVAAVEKKESENFNAGNAQHATVIQQMMLDIKDVELQEAQQTVESLLINRSSLEAQLDYYLKLIGEPDSVIPKPKDDWVDIQQSIDAPTTDELRMSSYENTEMKKSLLAGERNFAAVATDGIAMPLYLVPQLTTDFKPLGVGGSISFAGSAIAEAVAAASTLARGLAAVSADEAARADKKASLTMQLRERRLQANITGREMKSIDKEVEIQRLHITSIEKEIEMQKSEVEDAAGAEEWYKTKYTSERLYTWMEKIFRDLYFQAYELAMTMALRAESSLNFEGGSKISIIRKGGYWNTSQGGLLAAEMLYLDLRRLESAHLEGPAPDYNISKTVSLKDFDPLALMKLRITGVADFSVGELLYDMDFPGHYMRRIRTVSVSIPSASRAGSDTNAVLTLLAHKYRVNQNADNYAASQSDAGSEAFRTDRLPITSIAVSSGAQDSGVFELDFSSPRLMPFEGAGAISTWRLEFPAPIRHFDYESITDVQLHVQYTAYEGGPTLKKAAKGAVLQAAQTIEAEGQHQGYWALWDLKNDFSGGWGDFESKIIAGKVEASLDLGNLKPLLPYWSRHQKDLQVQTCTLMTRSQNLRARLSISVPNAPNYTGTDGTLFGGLFSKTFDMTEKSLNWKILAKTSPPAVTASENVYMFVRYIYVGRNIS